VTRRCCRAEHVPRFARVAERTEEGGLEATHWVLRRENVVWMPGDGSLVDQIPPLPSTLAIAVMVFQLRVVTGTPKSRSNVPR